MPLSRLSARALAVAVVSTAGLLLPVTASAVSATPRAPGISGITPSSTAYDVDRSGAIVGFDSVQGTVLWKDGRTVVLVPSGTPSRDGRLSDNGWIAAEVGDVNAAHPRRWKADGSPDGVLPEVGTVVAVTNDGAVAVQYNHAVTGAYRGGLWRRDGLVELRLPAGWPSTGYVSVADVNNRGEVVGTAFDQAYERAPEGVRCDSTGACATLRLPDGAPAVGTFPAAINDSGQVVACECAVPAEGRVHRWTGGVATELPRPASTTALSVHGKGSLNERGDVVGAAGGDQFAQREPVLWLSGAAPVRLGPVGSPYRFDLAEINDHGDVVASEYTSNARDVVFWRGTAKTRLALLPLRSEGVATGLNNAGRVVGSSAYAIGSFPTRTLIERATYWDVR